MAYTGNVVSRLPDWNPDISVIAEPPNDKKLTGWQPDEKPPAQWFNWLNAGFYKSIKEIDDMFNKTSGHGHTGVDGDAPKLDPTKAFTYAPVNKAGDTMTGGLVLNGHSVEICRPDLSTGGWARGYTIKDTDDNRLVQFGTRGSVYNGVNTVHHHFIGRSSDDTFMKLYTDKRVTFDGNVEVNGALYPAIPHTTGAQPGTVYPKGLSADIASGDATYPLTHGTIFNVKIDNSRFTQLLFSHGAAGNTDMRFRHFYVDNWSDWATVFTDKNHHTYTPLAANGYIAMTGSLVMEGHSIKIRRPQGEGGWARGYDIVDKDNAILLELGTHGGVVSGVNTVKHHYIGRAYNDTFMRFYEDKRVTVDGNIGIGTQNPLSKISIKNVGATNDVNLVTFSENETEEFVLKGMFEGAGEDGNSMKLTSVWKNNVMVWRGDGKIGIGMAEPAYPLDVSGQIRSYSTLSDKEDMLILHKSKSWSTIVDKHQNIVWKDTVNTIGAIGAKYDGSNVVIDFHSMFSSGLKTDSDISFSVFGNGTRPMKINSTMGTIFSKGAAGSGWAQGYAFEGSEGTYLGGFLAYGGSDVLHYYYIGSNYTNPLVKVTPEGHMVVKGTGSFGAGAEALSLLPGGHDHTYIQFFPRSAEPNSRGGYIGYGSAGTSTLTLRNGIGNIDLSPHGGTVNVNGTLEATDIKSNGVKVPTIKVIGTETVGASSGEIKKTSYYEENSNDILIAKVESSLNVTWSRTNKDDHSMYVWKDKHYTGRVVWYMYNGSSNYNSVTFTIFRIQY